MDRVLMVDPENCTACSICELVCSFEHHGQYNPKKSYIRVSKNRELGVHLPLLTASCDLCGGDEKCALWCPTECIKFVPLKEAAQGRRGLKLSPYPSPLLAS